MITQDGIATAGRCFLFGLVIASPTTPLHQALLKAMQGHVLAKGELVGVFQAPQ